MNEHNIPFILEAAVVQPRKLPLVPEITLYLMADNYPAHSLQQEEYARLMERPPYWAFCWGGGQALARWIFDNAKQVQGKFVVDFGAGSGVAGIAAALKGAARVVAVDIDPDALTACQLNSALNGVGVEVSTVLSVTSDGLMLAADVGYEEAGWAAVVDHIASGGHAVVAESRLRDLHKRVPALNFTARYSVRTFPDLEEAEMFTEVHIFSTF